MIKHKESPGGQMGFIMVGSKVSHRGGDKEAINNKRRRSIPVDNVHYFTWLYQYKLCVKLYHIYNNVCFETGIM